MKKIAVALLALVLWVSIWSYFYLYKWVSLSTVDANPDYICKKAVSDQPCVITTCSTWGTDWKRTCNWIKTTEVAYYLIRTDCEAGYTKHYKWDSSWNSWRQEPDYVSWTQSCTVVEVDNVPPVWDISE